MLSKRQLLTSIGLAATVVVIAKVGGCSSGSKAGDEQATCGALDLGEEKVEQCPNGRGTKTYICTEKGLKVALDECSGGGAGGDGGGGGGDDGGGGGGGDNCRVDFAVVKQVLTNNCVGCHAGIDTYDTAKSWYTTTPSGKPGILADVQVGSALHMPPGQQLGAADIAVLKQWGDDGFPKAGDCDDDTDPPPPPAEFMDFGTFESKLSEDLSRNVATSAKQDTRWLVWVDRIDAGADVAELARSKAAASKAINSVSTDRQIHKPVEVAPGIVRIDISDYGISAAEWTRIEQASKLKFESETQTGKALKDITKSTLPWMFVQDFIDAALHDADVYYDLIEAPTTLQQLISDLGVDFSGDLRDGKAALIGFNGSRLSPAANRLMARFDSDDGVFWLTEDTGPIVSGQQNIFNAPLIVAAQNNNAVMQFAQGEMIYSLPNGLHAYFLADVNGVRLNQADPNVVHDFITSPTSPIIQNALSCYRCHNGGIIPATDRVLDRLRGTPNSRLSGADFALALASYKPKATNDALFRDDNAVYADAAKKAGFVAGQLDPITGTSDKFLGDLEIDYVSGLFFQTGQQFKETCLTASADVAAEAGQLASPGGNVSHDQLVQVVGEVKEDCRVFKDPISFRK